MLTPRGRNSISISPGRAVDPQDYETMIVTASHDKTLRVWDIQTGECLHILNGHNHKVYYCTVQQDGKASYVFLDYIQTFEITILAANWQLSS